MAELRHLYPPIGPGPLREALLRLAGEDLVTTEGQRAFRVAAFSAADVDDFTICWQILEEGVLRAAMARQDAHWKSAIVAAFQVLERRAERTSSDIGERDSCEEALRAFHLVLTSGAGSPRAVHIQAALYDHAKRYRHLLYGDLVFSNAMLEGYRSLIDLVLTCQTEAAVAKLRELLTTWRDRLRRLAGS